MEYLENLEPAPEDTAPTVADDPFASLEKRHTDDDQDDESEHGFEEDGSWYVEVDDRNL
jgi:hypothetical protein